MRISGPVDAETMFVDALVQIGKIVQAVTEAEGHTFGCNV